MHRQLAGELAPDGERRRLVLAGSKEIEPGARAMLLLAEKLFRLDIVLSPDTVRTLVRNLSTGELKMEEGSGYADPTALATAEAASHRPTSTRVAFALGAGADRVRVQVLIGMLRFAERGTVLVTAQAIVRQAPAG